MATIAAVLCVLVLVVVLIVKISSGGTGTKTGSNLLKGSFVYEDNTIYEFDGSGTGCMCITSDGGHYHYEYTYTIKDDQLMLDFEAEEVRDATYTYELKGDTLTITGGEGTAGGTYTLTRSESE